MTIEPELNRRQRLLRRIFGRPQAPQPDWVESLKDGTDAGLFGPGSAVWAVNGAAPVIVAGVRALLLQTLHPGAMAGVHDWSRYREDTMGRFRSTVRWVLTTTYGDTDAAASAARWVSGVHDKVRGTYADNVGTERSYSAHDPQLLSWVHVAFTEAFLGAHLVWGGEIPGGADRYVEEWAESGVLLGVLNPPRSVAELRAQLAAFEPDLKPDQRVIDAVAFLRKPPVPKETRLAYRIFFAGAVATLPQNYRRMLGLRRPWWPAISATRVVLALMDARYGRVSPSELAAMERIAKLFAH